MTASGAYRIRHHGISYEVAAVPGQPRTARLLADGDVVDEGTTGCLERATLTHGDTRVDVGWDVRNRIRRADLVEKIEGSGLPVPRQERTPLEPPPGTRAARLARFKREHPRAYAARHVALAVAETVAALIGLRLLLGQLLPHLDLPRLPRIRLPRPDLPSLPLPDLPDLPELPDLAVPGWISAILNSLKYVTPFVVAIAVAAREVKRRRAKEQARAEREAAYSSGRAGASPGTGTGSGSGSGSGENGARGTDG